MAVVSPERTRSPWLELAIVALRREGRELVRYGTERKSAALSRMSGFSNLSPKNRSLRTQINYSAFAKKAPMFSQ